MSAEAWQFEREVRFWKASWNQTDLSSTWWNWKEYFSGFFRKRELMRDLPKLRVSATSANVWQVYDTKMTLREILFLFTKPRLVALSLRVTASVRKYLLLRSHVFHILMYWISRCDSLGSASLTEKSFLSMLCHDRHKMRYRVCLALFHNSRNDSHCSVKVRVEVSPLGNVKETNFKKIIGSNTHSPLGEHLLNSSKYLRKHKKTTPLKTRKL